jgi:alpha-tubulin suppressor-like RCC1 family protein
MGYFCPKDYLREPAWVRWGCSVALVLFLASCGDASPENLTAPSPSATAPPAVHSVSIETSGGELRFHQEVQLRFVARDAQGNVIAGPEVTWSSSQPFAVSVSESGLIRGEGIGTARITAKVGAQEAAVSFTVPSRQVDIQMDHAGIVSVVDLNHDIECDRDCSRRVALGATLDLRIEKGIGVPAVSWPAPCPSAGAERCMVRVDDDIAMAFTLEPPARPSAFASAIAVGHAMACALTDAGDAYCWGSNNGGKLGRGTWSGFSPDPERVQHGEPFHSITVGHDHACGLTRSGAALCWGNNYRGTLGDGSGQSRAAPGQVSGNPRFVQMSAGLWHTCAVTGTGEAYCWGRNQNGELGDGSQTDRRRPTRVQTDVKLRQVSAGNTSTCGLSLDGALYCWGNNDHGQLATGDFNHALQPRRSSSRARYSAVDVGSSMGCAVRVDGVLDCWGEDRNGNLGQGHHHSVRVPDPATVSGHQRFASVAVGHHEYACALTGEGAALCWGGNWDGSLGTGGRENANRPVPVAGSHRFMGLGAGSGLTCGIDEHGQVLCWGRAHEGALGPGVQSFSAAPVALTAVPKSQALVSQSWTTHCSVSDGSADLYCWGGWGPILHRDSEWEVSLQLQGFRQVALGGGQVCGIRSVDGALLCMGNAHRGRLGNGWFDGWLPYPGYQIRPDFTFRDVVAGPEHTCALDTNGQAYCWGGNQHGQLGDGGWQDRAEPVPVAQGNLRFAKLSAANQVTCGITSDSDLWCWGQNDHGQLGVGSQEHRNRPSRVLGGLKVSQVAIGGSHTCLLTIDGAAYCWGAQWAGQIGTRSNREQLTPFRVPGNLKFTAISLGASHSCATTSAGQVWCWGENGHGQLGIGHRDEVLGLQTVAGIPAVAELSSTWATTCARSVVGDVFCWGQNGNGQLAIEMPRIPVHVPAPERFRTMGSTK